MDLEGILLSEISQIEKDKYRMISLICGILKNKRQAHTCIKQIGEARGRGWGFGISRERSQKL